MTPVEQQQKFFRLARSGAGYLAWQRPGGKFHQSWFASDAMALSLIGRHSVDSNIWVSMAEFPTRDLGRCASGAARLSSLWLDVDAHEGGKHTDPRAVSNALMEFVRVTDLPRPSIMHFTGHGFHAVWTFEKTLPRVDWLPLAEKFQQLSDCHQLDADRITADSARILRVPGTLNFRDPSDPRPATMHVFGDGIVNFDQFVAALDTAHAKLPPQPIRPMDAAPSRAMRADFDLGGNVVASADYPPSDASLIAEKCAVIRHIRDTGGNVSEPLWHGALGVLVHTIQSDTVCHDWSRGHPAYNEAETQAKIDRLRAFGPTTCVRLCSISEGLCRGCSYGEGI